MDYSYAMENRDLARIDKLNKLTNKETFWDDVRRLTRYVKSDHAIHSWQYLAEKRWMELQKENWIEFYKRVINTNGNPSTKDAEECNIPFEKWLRLATHPNLTSEKLVSNAKTALELLERR